MKLPLRNRRQVERQPITWTAQYRTRSTDLWYHCVTIDVTIAGARVELWGPTTPVGARVLLKLQVGGAEGMQLAATVTSAAPTASGGSRVGLEFANLTPHQHATLQSLIKHERLTTAPN
jgi:hypothetical protein